MPPFVATLGTALMMVAILRSPRLDRWLPKDRPGGRKLQVRPMPLVGLVPAAVAVISFAFAGWILAAVSVALATAVGLLDDTTKERSLGLGWKWKLVPLLLAAVIGAHGVVPMHEAPILACVVLLFLFVITNAVNFLDNTDGVCLVVVILGLFLASHGASADGAPWSDHPAAWPAFAALGLLPFNWPKARMYCGDAGALGLGCALAIVAARSAFPDAGAPVHTSQPTMDQLSRCLAPVLLPVLDFTQVVLMRIWLGVPPWIGDRRHLTHIAMNLGLPRPLVAPVAAVLVVAGWMLLAPRG